MRWALSWNTTTHSCISDRKWEIGDRLEIVHDNRLKLRLFRGRGVTVDGFSVWRSEPELKEELMIIVMSEEIVGRSSLTKMAEMRTRTREELLIDAMKVGQLHCRHGGGLR